MCTCIYVNRETRERERDRERESARERERNIGWLVDWLIVPNSPKAPESPAAFQSASPPARQTRLPQLLF